MRNKLRSWLRRSGLFNSFLYYLILLPFPAKMKVKLSLFYLQSDSARKDIKNVIKRGSESISFNKLKESIELYTSAIIKPYSESEKGVFLIGFEHELDSLLHHRNIDFISKNFSLLFMPTWQPFYSEALLRALKKKIEVTILPSSQQCYFHAIQMGASYYDALPFHASSWIDASIYKPKSKDIDILMVAGFGIYKRHYLLFEALQYLPKTLKVVLVGRPLRHRTKEVLLAEAESYGVKDRFELIESPSNEEVRDYLSRANLVLGLSGREGSYVSLAEALFADAAVAIYSNAFVGTKNYINPQTGFLLQEGAPLHKQIEKCLSLLGNLSPREWAINNISNEINLEKMNRLLKRKAEKNGEAWTSECELFRVQNFVIQSPENKWSEHIISNTDKLKERGINFPNFHNNDY